MDAFTSLWVLPRFFFWQLLMIGFYLGKMLEILSLALSWMTKAKDGNVKKGKRKKEIILDG